MTTNQAPPAVAAEAVNSVRSGILATSIAGIVLGILVMVWPSISVFIAGIFFGIALLIAGFYRLFFAFAAPGAPFALRMFLLVVGVLLVAMGVLAIISPENSWFMLAIFIGVSWIFSGFQDIFGARADYTLLPRWLVIVGGVISVVAGIVMLVLSPTVTLPTIVWVMGLMLVIVSITTLVALPKKIEV